MKTLFVFLTLLSITVFSGCTPQTKTVYVDRDIEVFIPQKCYVKKTFCSEEGSLREGTLAEFMRCVYELREAAKVCQ